MDGMARSSDTFQTLASLVRTELGEPDCALAVDTRLLDLGGWDSIKTIGLILAIEQHFGFLISAREVDTLERVGDFVRAIDRGDGATTTRP